MKVPTRRPTKEEADRLGAVRDRIMNAMAEELQRNEVTALELLSVFAFVTGATIAYQDQGVVHPAQAMTLVAQNITEGNLWAIANLMAARSGKPN